ncbi:hypothetical protein PanWU01x14_130770 [Parasponia andersonii]|uniref:Uncharacterized protein n=1 Tax=Parasponia andersonii TaxID=3476 RepID=A0A2P5CQX9_PARAD|nr:hypothetical protein PanWU01x14_130770 [Parasponia andersonii]
MLSAAEPVEYSCLALGDVRNWVATPWRELGPVEATLVDTILVELPLVAKLLEARTLVGKFVSEAAPLQLAETQLVAADSIGGGPVAAEGVRDKHGEVALRRVLAAAEAMNRRSDDPGSVEVMVMVEEESSKDSPFFQLLSLEI